MQSIKIGLIFLTSILFCKLSLADILPDKVIGTNDMVAVNDQASNIPARYRNFVDAFGITDGGCSATHLGRGIVLTAGHCFWAPEVPVEDQACEGVSVSWGIRGNKKAYLKSTCEKLILAQRSPLGDFAIFKVTPEPTDFILPDMQRHAAMGDTLTLFSHPDFMPLQWSQLCGFERESNPFLPPRALMHKCDTNPGSSGAAIINAISLKIVGIHDGGQVDENSNGMNYGTFILSSPLAEKLRQLGF